jgi:hypothetical protein
MQAKDAYMQAINAVHPGVDAVSCLVLSNGICHTRAWCSLPTIDHIARYITLRLYVGCTQPAILRSEAPVSGIFPIQFQLSSSDGFHDGVSSAVNHRNVDFLAFNFWNVADLLSAFDTHQRNGLRHRQSICFINSWDHVALCPEVRISDVTSWHHLSMFQLQLGIDEMRPFQ